MANNNAKAITRLLTAMGRLPEGVDPDSQESVDASTARLAEVVEQILEEPVMDAIERDDAFLAEVRRFFLHPDERYSMEELAALWRITLDDARDIYFDEMAGGEVSGNANSCEMRTERIEWANAMGTAVVFGLLRPFDVECALGAEFARVRSDRWRTVPVLIRIPRFVADALELEASIPQTLPLAHRIERILLDLCRNEFMTGSLPDKVIEQ
jgi:hypothetical protein